MKNFHSRESKYVYQISLKVENLERSLDFYTSVLGFKVLSEDNKEIALTADGINPIIILSQPKNVIKKIPKRTGLYHIAILLPVRSDLGSLLINLKDKNYPLDGGSDHNVSEAIYLRDPDENGIEIYTDVDSDKWTWENNKVKMTTDFLNYEELLSLAKNDDWKGMPEETIIGHIHLHVSDLEKAKDFYVNGLGFDITAVMGGTAVFLSDGGYHHHIALNIWNGTGIDPLPENSAGMNYYTIVFPDEQTKQISIEKLKVLGYKIFDTNNEIFTKDPSGNLIKFIL